MAGWEIKLAEFLAELTKTVKVLREMAEAEAKRRNNDGPERNEDD